jgi:predicted alpha/beta-hydrolase family hydrolase
MWKILTRRGIPWAGDNRRMEVAASFEGPRGQVEALWDRAPAAVAVAVLAHGAGAGMTHPFMAGAAAGLVEAQVSALRFNFPYVTAGRRSPDRPEVAIATWRAALEHAVAESDGVPVVAGGKSYGGRMASMLAAEEAGSFPAVGLVFFGYPLHAPGRADQPRDGHLSAITVPMLFIEGTDDPFARFDLIEGVAKRLGSLARLHVIDGGDHSFRVRGAKRPDQEIGRELGGVAAAFIREVAG